MELWLSPGCGLPCEAIHKTKRAQGNRNGTHNQDHCKQVQ